jgi:hypothetical protein
MPRRQFRLRDEFGNSAFGGGTPGFAPPYPPAYSIYAVTLNGIADFFSKDGNLSGLPGSATNLLMYVWAKHRFFTNNNQIYFSSEGNYQAVARGPSTILNKSSVFFLDDSAGYIAANGSQTITANVWNLFALSINISNMVSPTVQMLLNNTLDPSVVLDNNLTSTHFKLGSYANWNVGAGDSGSDPVGGDIAMFYLNYSNTFFDLSVTANKRKIITATGKPVNPGANGSLVTGSAPQIYMFQSTLMETDPIDFVTNRGNGGSTPPIFFTVGSPGIAPTTPST